MPTPLRITTVRHGPDKGRELLQTHIFGGKYKLPRVPRGVDPALVSEFILKELKPNSPRDAYLKTLDTLRYYERQDVVDHVMSALSRKEATYIDLMRSLYAIQIAGDIGAEPQRQTAAKYLDSVIIPHALAEQAYPTIAQTLVVLAPPASPAGSPAAFTQRVGREIKLREPLQNESEAAMMAYDKSVEVRDQTIPAAEKSIAGKTALLKKKPAERAGDLVSIYLGKHELADPYMSVWAARRIRFDVAEEGGEGFAPHEAAFLKAIDAIDPKEPPNPETDLVLVRAVQAILYFQQNPGLNRVERYAKARGRPVIHLNFLWDDDE